MTSKQMSSQALRLAENATCLGLRAQIPPTPSFEPRAPAAVDSNATRILSLGRERGLASGLAFLAGISDDGNNVVAACIEETPRPDELIVRLAINKQMPQDGEPLVESIKCGLQSVFNVLAMVERDCDESLKTQVFHSIIRFCRIRILQRIGSHRPEILPLYSKGVRTYLGDTVTTVSDVVASGIPRRQRRIRAIHISDAQRFVSHSKNFVVLLNELESCGDEQVDLKLSVILNAAHVLLEDTSHFRSLLRGVGEDKSSLSLKNRLGELAAYGHITSYLYETAQHTNLFRHVRVEPILLDERCFNIPSAGSHAFDLDDCVARSCPGDSRAVNRLFSREENWSAVNGVRLKFAALAQQAVKNSKIHAEIQILAHYRLNPSERPPRFIASSKAPCYLCNTLIRIDGQYEVPETHGRLYRAWKLPSLPLFDELGLKLNQDLESQINKLSQQNQWRAPPCDNYTYEGAVLPLGDSISLLRSLPVNPSSLEPSLPNPRHLPILESLGPRQDFQLVDEVPALRRTTENHDLDDTAMSTSRADSNETPSHTSVGDEDVGHEQPATEPRVPGIFINFQPVNGKWSRSYEDQLQVAFARLITGLTSKLDVEWLTDEEAKKAAYERWRVPMAGVDTARKARAISSCSQDYVLLKFDRKVVRMNMVAF